MQRDSIIILLSYIVLKTDSELTLHSLVTGFLESRILQRRLQRCIGSYIWFDKTLTTARAKICNTFKSATFFLINSPTFFLWWSDEPDQIVGWSAQRLHPDSSRNCSSTQRLRISNEAVVTRGKDLMSVCCSQRMVDGGGGEAWGCWICLSTTLRDHSFSLCTDLEIEEIVKS